MAQTAGWETQMGADINWGGDDETLIFNDVDTGTWTVHGVKLNWKSGKKDLFDRGVYNVYLVDMERFVTIFLRVRVL